MRRDGFTLIELLTIIAIMGTMVAVGVVSWQNGKSRAQLAGATRDILAVVRQARSIALVTQKPAIITYATEKDEDDVPFARITVETAKLFDDSSVDAPVYTLSGERVGGEPARDAMQASTGSDVQPDAAETSGGESLSDVLMPKISLDVVKGLRIKVLKEDEQLAFGNGPITYKSGISVFSTSGAVRHELGKTAPAATSTTESAPALAEDATSDAPVEIVWSTNGRADGHTIWIYPDGSQPEKGLSIVVDKFGGCKVSQWEDEE